MSAKDVIKSSIYESFGGGTGLSIYSILLILFVACLVGAYIFFVYKSFSKSAFYSKDLNTTIAGMPIIVAAIMIAMQSNLLVSLGMVGALSIVRFRTAVKNPLDLLYLFWSISAGIICGVGLYALSAGLSIIMTCALWILSVIPNSKAPALIVIKMRPDADVEKMRKYISDNSRYVKQVSLIVRNGEKEIIYEVNTSKGNVIIESLTTMADVVSANLLEHHGEIRA